MPVGTGDILTIQGLMLSAFRMEYRVITALVIREINTRYGRENVGFLWIIDEPILFVTGITIA